MAFGPAFLSALLALPVAFAQLSGRVGPTTPLSAKQATICNVLDFGGSVGSSDIGPAIGNAFTNCVLKNPNGATLYLPPGNYNMQTWQTLNGGSKWAFQMDGVITRTSTAGGNMIAIQNANDFEFFSSNSAGAIQGNGFQCRNAGPRLVRIVTSNNFSMHDLILVDSPEFHLVIQQGSNGEIYNMAIRGTNLGGSDGIDVWGTNYWIHDIEVTNRDECVTVKSPANNILVERIWCNQSGGSAIGSLGTGTAIQDILYRNVYTNGGNQIFMIKSNGGSGFVKNVLFDTSLSRETAYGLNVDQYWSSEATQAGDGVQLSNITFRNWDGAVVNGVQRSPIQILCADGAPCSEITLQNVNLWSDTNAATNKCRSAFGTGAPCLRSGTPTSYSAVTTTISRPAGFTTPPSLSGDLSQGFATNSPIPIPTIPTTFYPGLPQISPLAKNS
ncbi:rhamnogalacturonan-hydrolase [Fomitiporia mediterranea MF3/22]|uniref:rhamnogalacturonan-hydrolase n=1 Tax=Fomitiporia mediterranea (strain MF3/22) TaxID=694068 RepID=UPI00044089AF|nr:rhamnogalacturonan-hydrolase [Fomitiporia mediterranea MF3/22]EJD00592.1 rhamnogalacturonan-hydrolase [Fomitiporia mediterranea MF3/22]